MASNVDTFPPPPDCPKIVTFCASPPKRGYILVYPLKCRHEVEQAGIAGFGVFVAVGGKVEEAEDVETVVERDYHRITFLGKVETVVGGKFLSAACRIAAAVKPHHDGTLLAVVQARSPDVDPQAVFAGIAVVPVEGESVLVGTPAHTHRLGAGGTEHAAAAHAFPFIGRPRGHEALCLGVGNTFIYIDTVLQELLPLCPTRSGRRLFRKRR